ncbi:unnamed protein product [Bursaphelenchus xylophilus]|uniref:(pine wood nematode) hypothetical protein n=1 Tax=Bursaphelenchus xylophilus TaxID=6326 RepID=A0A1I7S019_BURXY|nr:unnamed protein product [Bursaphelenchus xylophilus]CAG9109078.1 unnamed protein product [Bursaphelenchus xylophilus]
MKLVAAGYAINSSTCLDVINRESSSDWKEVYHRVSKCAGPLNDKCTVLVVRSEEQRKLLIAFRGTDSVHELIDELAQTLNPEQEFLGGHVHHYFLTAFNHIWPPIKVILEDPETSDYPVIFSGMSLGGALAAIAAAVTVDLNFRSSEDVALRTYGEPRVGDYHFALNFDKLVPNSYRLVNKRDIVPHIPPCKPSRNETGCVQEAMHYFHHGTEVWYPNGCHTDGDFSVCSGRLEDPACSNSLLTNYTIFDHIGGYFLNAGAFAEEDCHSDFVNLMYNYVS